MTDSEPEEPQSSDTPRLLRTVVLVVALLVAVVAVGGLVHRARGRAPSTKFCTMGLEFGSVHGTQVVLQDQGGPGEDGCDLPDHGEDTDIGPTLGFDCKVRDGSGKVVDSVPKMADGSCDTR